MSSSPMAGSLAALATAREELLALVSDVRPELHRDGARLTGSAIEDVRLAVAMWEGGQVSFIRDHRYVTYIAREAHVETTP